MCHNASFFAFLGANVVGITYAVDSFPSRAEAILVVICAGRGIMSFGLSYATLPSISAIGYDGALNMQGNIAAGFSALAIVFTLLVLDCARRRTRRWEIYILGLLT